MAVRPRAVLDTNVFVSGLISPQGPPAAILRALRRGRFVLVSSPPINDEIIKVLTRPTIRDRYGLGDRVFDVAFILWELAELVTDVPGVRVSSDPDDNKFLATADARRADYLVTGDIGDLLRLRKYNQVTITSPRQFLAVLKASSEQGKCRSNLLSLCIPPLPCAATPYQPSPQAPHIRPHHAVRGWPPVIAD